MPLTGELQHRSRVALTCLFFRWVLLCEWRRKYRFTSVFGRGQVVDVCHWRRP